MTKFDFSKPETQALYETEVRKRVELFGMSREQAEMLVSVLMTEPPKVYGTLTRPPPGQDGTLMAEPEYEDDDVVMIRDLREALKFYADEKNYLQRGWQGDPDPSLVASDNGKIAREALEKK